MASLMALLAVPRYGLAGVFLIAFISATLLPLGSEPAVLGLVKLNPSMFWPAVLVATLGNTLGGAVTWWMGYGAEKAYRRVAHRDVQPQDDARSAHCEAGAHPLDTSRAADREPHPHDDSRAARWLRRFGPKACLLSWLPVIGDPLCAVAGWLRLPFWPCVAWMSVGKGLRYLVVTTVASQLFPQHFGA